MYLSHHRVLDSASIEHRCRIGLSTLHAMSAPSTKSLEKRSVVRTQQLLQDLTVDAFREQAQTPCAEAKVEEDFKRFSTEHSWYKMTEPEEMFILPAVQQRAPKTVTWTAAPKRHLTEVQDLLAPSTVKAIRANTITINALVFAGAPDCEEMDRHGIYSTQERGGDTWIRWLRASGYVSESEYAATHPLDDNDPIVIQLRQKEYARMLGEFKTKLAAIQQAE